MDKWNATERLKYAGRLFSVYNTAANALMVAQEGERRAHGFDYRDQRKAANADAQDQTRRAELMTEIAGLIEIITSKEPETMRVNAISTQTTMRGPQPLPTAPHKDRRQS
jgi:hypothetical protein